MVSPSEHQYKLEIDPKILELLGPHLYTNIYFVLAELIANAYDADAKNVYIIEKKDAIIVEDDGNGMSYQDTKKYLNVAEETRSNKSDSYTPGKRRKIGRKGIGKLAALSVSENVWVQTVKDEEKIGFVLSRHLGRDRLLDPISQRDIKFEVIKKQGTSIVMKDPLHGLSKYFETIKKNLLKIFPLIGKDFRIHVRQLHKEEKIIDKFDEEIIKDLGALIILGDDFKYLKAHFKVSEFPGKEKELLSQRKAETKTLKLTNKAGQNKDYKLEIKGWVGAYKTTRGRKAGHDDFPDNFISLLSNRKLGEYNILPVVGKNKLYEVYVVGQIHVDLFEETELPDMALANRQGYRTDDQRYGEVITYISKTLLPQIVDMRSRYSDFDAERKKKDKLEKQQDSEDNLKKLIEHYKEAASSNASKKISKEIENLDAAASKKVERIIRTEINELLPLVGIKKKVDEQKRKVLICHTKRDKDLADVIYALLIFNGAQADGIIYTNCDDEASRIPDDMPVWDYLRNFFIDSYSTEKIYVVYVTSDDMAKSWGAVTEVGAGWITKMEHKVFNLEKHTPQKPLDTDVQWHNSIRAKNDSLTMSKDECDKFAARIEHVCDKLGFKKKSRKENVKEIGKYVDIV